MFSSSPHGVTAVLAVVLSLSGCYQSKAEPRGFADQSARQIYQAALADMGKLHALSVRGQLFVDGDLISIDVSLSGEGDCRAALDYRGGSSQLRVSDGASYVKGDLAFWENAFGDLAKAKLFMKALRGRWATTPAETVSDLCDLDTMLRRFRLTDSGVELEKGTVAEIEGVEAVGLIDTSNDQSSTAWVAVEGRHLILKVEGDDPAEGGSAVATLSEFDAPVDVQRPPPREVFNPSVASG